MSSSTRTYRGGSVVAALQHVEERTVLVISDSCEATITPDTNGKPIVAIARQIDQKAIFPGLKPAKIGKKIYYCPKFLLAEVGDADFATIVCEDVVKSTNTKIDNGEKITRKALVADIRKHFNDLSNQPKTPTTFVLVTPEEYLGTEFTITVINKKEAIIDRTGFVCLGCGEKETRQHLTPKSKWVDKSVEATKSLLRNGVYESAKAHTDTVGGPVVIHSWTLEDRNGDTYLVRNIDEYPPWRDVLPRTLFGVSIFLVD